MEKLFISLAYKYVMLALMVAEANYAVEKLKVPGWQPVTMAEVTSYNISPPRLRAGGSFDTTHYFFGFGENKLQFIQRVLPDSGLELQERQAHWAQMESLIGTNEAYQLATNWLTMLDVDVEGLQKAYPVTVQQQFYYPNGDMKQKPVMLPQFDVRWGTNKSLPAVWVSIFGPTKTPIHIRQEDGSFIRRPVLIDTKIESLLSITNNEFAEWTTQQRSNLIVQASRNVYSSLECPEVISTVMEGPTSSKRATGLQGKGHFSGKRVKKVLPRVRQDGM